MLVKRLIQRSYVYHTVEICRFGGLFWHQHDQNAKLCFVPLHFLGSYLKISRDLSNDIPRNCKSLMIVFHVHSALHDI